MIMNNSNYKEMEEPPNLTVTLPEVASGIHSKNDEERTRKPNEVGQEQCSDSRIGF
jgi:hypothetical protein